MVKSMNKTVLFAVHDLSIALKYCNKVGILKDGKLVQFGTAKDIINPENIKAIYGVDAVIVEDQKGVLHVQYLGVSQG